MKNQITTEELTKLQNLVTVLTNVQNQIGKVETEKHILLHQFDIIGQQLNKLKSELKETYGDVDIDFKTGKFSKMKKNESNKKN